MSEEDRVYRLDHQSLKIETVCYAGAVADRARRPRTLSDTEALGEFFRFFGVNRSVHLIGWITLWSLRGQPTLGRVVELHRRTGISTPTTYRVIADIKRWREHYALIEGREVDEIPGLDDLVRDLARRIDQQQLVLNLPQEKEIPA
jgi:hypothetical protein